MIMKKIAALALLVSVTESAQARPGYSGLYFGANIGGSFNKVAFSESNLTTVSDNKKKHLSMPFAGVFFGYSHDVNSCFYLGAEALVDGIFNAGEHLYRTSTISDSLKSRGIGYGAVARFGFRVVNTAAVFVGVGVRSSAWTLKSYDITNNVFAINTHRSTKMHFQAGAEGDFACTSFSWRLTYAYTHGKHVKIKDFPATHVLSGGFARAKPTDHMGSVGVFYRF